MTTAETGVISAPVEDQGRPATWAVPTVALLIAAAGVAFGLVLRLWLVFHRPLTADQAIVGLMAHQILHGQMFTFYWGQSYGGVEPYVVAAWASIVGSGPVALNTVPVVLSFLTAMVVWRICARVTPGRARLLALAAGVVVWEWPAVLISNSTTELGFRGVALLAGAGLIWLSLRVTETPSVANLIGLGLVAGVGWWSSPEIVYFVVPAGGVLLAGRAALRRVKSRLLLVPGAFLIGALPWLVTNVRSGFPSLRTSSSPEYLHSTYAGRLGTFVEKTFPMMLGLREPLSDAWVWGHAGQVLYVIGFVMVGACLVAAVTGFRLGDRGPVLRPIAVGCLAFPFLFALFPATSFWEQGQYGIYVVPLVVVLVTGVGASVAFGRRRAVRPTAAPGAVAVVALIAVATVTAASFDAVWLRGNSGFFSGWSGPSRIAEQTVGRLEAAGVRTAYAEYWVAYDLDYLSHERLQVTDPYTDRWLGEYTRVASAPDPAWLFLSPSQLGAARAAFSATAPGPFNYPESLFVAKLKQLNIGYRVEHAGVLDAVVPSRPVAASEVGIPAPFWH